MTADRATEGHRHSVAASPVLLWTAFILVHFWLGFVNLYGPGVPLGDVSSVYRFWTDQAIISHYWVGIDAPWVYPIVALLPMLAARIFGVAQYSATWLAMIMLLDAVAFAAIVGWGHRRQNSGIAWWWLLFLVVLGPIALGRIDSVTIPIALVGVLLLSSRPRVAVFLLTIATWIKVWPAAIIVAAVIALRNRASVLATGAVTSAAIIVVAVLLGAGANVFSFITQQTARGLQIEAPVSTIWLWRAFAGARDTAVYYDTTLLTWQIRGAGVDAASSAMNPLLAISVLAVALLGIAAVRNRAPVTRVLPALALAFVVAFIAFNKVGSPQYITWLAVPVILGLATRVGGNGPSFRVPAALTLVIAGLTQIIYPYLYGYLLNLDPLMLLVVSVKDVLLLVLLGWAGQSLWRSARATDHEPQPTGQWIAAPWPFASDHASFVGRGGSGAGRDARGPNSAGRDSADRDSVGRDSVGRDSLDSRHPPG